VSVARDKDAGVPTPRPYEPLEWDAALAHWRAYPAEQFDDELKQQVRSCVKRIHTTIDDWRAAIEGDAAAAVKVALRIRMPETITARLDLAMTVLAAAAFEDANAAAVLAHLVDRAPLDPVDKTGISTSWLVHKIWCESRILNRRRSLQGRTGGGA
jgi:hypothetical protein